MRFVSRFGLALVLGVAASALGDEPTHLTRIVTVVRGEDGAPVAGAVVEAVGAPSGPVRRETGADGVARFDEMPARGIVYVARKGGFCCGWHEPGRWSWAMPKEDADPDGDGVTRMRLVLVAGSRVSGTIVAKRGGHPIAGAVVVARVVEHATDVWALRGAPLWTATTDAEGRFATDEHWPAKEESGDVVSAVVVARAPGWISEETEISPDDAGMHAPLRFALLPAARLEGSVRLPDGTPAARVRVHAYPSDFWAFAPGQRNTRDTTESHPREMHGETDDAGRFAFPEATPDADYRVFAEAVGADDRATARSSVAAVRAAGKPSCELRLLALGSLRVRVAADAGEAAESFGVEFTPPAGARPWTTEDDEEGGAVVRDADAGEWTIEVRARGWGNQRTTVVLAAGEAKTTTVRLSRGATIEGTLVDDAGAPVAGATVYGYAIDPKDPERWLEGGEEAKSDAAGRFVLTGLRRGPTAVSTTHETLEQDGYLRADAPARGVTIVLHRPGTVRFRLKTADGAAAPTRARVTVTRRAGFAAGSQSQETLDAADGVFALAHVMPGPVWFAVETRGFAPFVTALDVRPGVSTEPEPFVLSRGLPLRGRVVDARGRPLAGARVLAWGNEDTGATTGDRGTFAIPHLAPGAVEVSVVAEGMAMLLLDATVGADQPPLEIVLTPGGVVSGRVVDVTGGGGLASIDVFPAAATDDNVARWRAAVADDGRYSLRLPPGRYRCALPRPGAERGPTLFDVTEGGAITLDLEFR